MRERWPPIQPPGIGETRRFTPSPSGRRGRAGSLCGARPSSPPDLCSAGRGGGPAGLASGGAGPASGPARRGLAAEPGRDRDRAARLLAQRLCLLPVIASRPHHRSGPGAGGPHAGRRAARPAGIRRRCRAARHFRRACRSRFRPLGLSGRPGRGPAFCRSARAYPHGRVERAASRDPNQIIYLPFTSGTTGAPKGVLHSDNTLLATARMMARDWGWSGSVLYTMSPLSHNLGLGALVTALVGGGELVVHDLPRGRSLVERLEETGADFPVRGADACDRPAGGDAGAGLAAAGSGARVPHLRRRGAGATRRRSDAPWRDAAERLRHDRDLLAPIHETRRPAERIIETSGRACDGYEIRIWRPGRSRYRSRTRRDRRNRRSRRQPDARVFRRSERNRGGVQRERMVHDRRSRPDRRRRAICALPAARRTSSFAAAATSIPRRSRRWRCAIARSPRPQRFRWRMRGSANASASQSCRAAASQPDPAETPQASGRGGRIAIRHAGILSQPRGNADDSERQDHQARAGPLGERGKVNAATGPLRIAAVMEFGGRRTRPMRAIVVDEFGPPEALRARDTAMPVPGPARCSSRSMRRRSIMSISWWSAAPTSFCRRARSSPASRRPGSSRRWGRR